MRRYALTIFLSAFLLFQVQPLIGKYILPWFGGSPAVWTTCMLLFQILLLVGYGYAHALTAWLPPARQALVHLALLVASLFFLPITPDESWKPLGSESPTWRIVALLCGTVGVPYFLLSTTGPLLQSWFSYNCPGRSPYRLYALSNVGSLLALVSYPFVVEPSLALGLQATVWSALYTLFVLGCGWCALRLSLLPQTPRLAAELARAASQVRSSFPSVSGRRPLAGDILLWLGFAAVGSVMLLATTNQLCQEVAVVPFLWVLPLGLYLLSFILSFDSDRWYSRRPFGLLLAASAGLAWFALDRGSAIRLEFQIAIYSLTLFACCMVCHGELARSKPHPRYLTFFFLLVATGGAIGGLFVAVIAPRLFSGYWEYHVGLGACCLLTLVAWFRDRSFVIFPSRPLWGWTATLCGFFVLVIALSKQAISNDRDTIERARNFYGVLRLEKKDEAPGPRYNLAHGRIVHGFQFEAADKRNVPTSYYGPDSGIGLAMTWHPKRQAAAPEDRHLSVGVIGLGAGTIAAYGQPGDYLRFYEINPDVVRLADERFSYLSDSAACCETVLGDGRIQMERELKRGEIQKFDILTLDAFSGDAIPMHLLTRECFETYWRHMLADGLLVLHISNRHVDLMPVVRGLAAEFGKQAIYITTAENKDLGTSISDWMIVTSNEAFLHEAAIQAATRPWPVNTPQPFVWTDDYGSLRQVLTR